MCKNFIRLGLMAISILTCSSALRAQALKDLLAKDIQGRVLVSGQYSNIEGYPYLFPKWCKGTVRFQDGRTVKQIDLKYDLVADELLFKDLKSDEALRFADQVAEFQLDSSDVNQVPMHFKNGFKPAFGNSALSYYQILFDGKTQLLKKKEKSILERKVYNSAVSTKTFEEDETYFIGRNNEITKFKRDKKQILTLLSDHAAEIEQFLASEKLNVKDDSDLMKLFAYYNSL